MKFMDSVRTRLGLVLAGDKALTAPISSRTLVPGETKKSMRLMWPSNWDKQQFSWTVGDYGAYADEGFTLNSLIYSAIMYKVRAQQSAPLRAYTGDESAPKRCTPSDPLSVLLARPNPTQSWGKFHGLNTVYLNVSGNAFIALIRRGNEPIPETMQPLRPDRIRIIPDSKAGGIMGYLWVPDWGGLRDSVPILPEDMIHVKFPDPHDPLDGLGFGLSPLAAASYPTDTDNLITKFLKQFFQYAAIPAGLLKFERPLSQEQVDTIRTRWAERYGGSEKWSEIGVLDQGGEYQRVGLNFEEMGFNSLDMRNESRVLGPLGVPAILISTRLGLSRSTYANTEQAWNLFWRDTFVPEQSLFEDEFKFRLVPKGDKRWVGFDYTRISALQQDTPKLVASAYQLWSMGVPANTAFTTVGLRGIGLIEGGDMGFMPGSVVPMKQFTEPPPAAPPPVPVPTHNTGPVQNETGGPNSTVISEENPTAQEAGVEARRGPLGGQEPRAKSAKARSPARAAHVATVLAACSKLRDHYESLYDSTAAQQLDRDRVVVLAAVNGTKLAAIKARSTPEFKALPGLLGGAVSRWAGALGKVGAGLIAGQSKLLAKAFGRAVPEGLASEAAILKDKGFLAAAEEAARATVQTTESQVGALLTAATAKGWGADEVSSRVNILFDQLQNGSATPEELDWMPEGERGPEQRSSIIAATVGATASSYGANLLYSDWGTRYQEWVTMRDDRVRPEHVEADGQVREFGEPFDVGGSKMMYPGDPDGGLDNICGCRCMLMPVGGEERYGPEGSQD